MPGQLSRRDVLKTVGFGALVLSAGPQLASAAADTPAPEPGGDYTLPELPYGYNALEPGISEQVLRLHHQKHHAGYVRGFNATLAKLRKARASASIPDIKALSRDLAFHGSGHVLHDLYWRSMMPGGAKLSAGPLASAIKRDFGSFDGFKTQFIAATKAVEGSGWGVLAFEPMGARLIVLQCEKHQNLTIWGCRPIMVCDVWEHAYYAQYHNRRGEYVDSFFNIIDWRAAGKRFGLATS